jgi:hypothetical protein
MLAMKKLLPYIVVGAIAVAIVAAQPFVVYYGDDFNYDVDPHHKVFTYGFPFHINDCPPSPVHTSGPQRVLRFIGNFSVWFFCGMVIVQLISIVRLRFFRRAPGAA